MDAAQYCYHCGGELAEGVLPFILPTDTAPATPRPGQACKCEEISEELEEYRRSSDPRINREGS
jgi:hypothetical protein